MNNNYSANLRFIKHFRLSNPESKAIDKKKVTETFSEDRGKSVSKAPGDYGQIANHSRQKT
jgi:hypothetical protein